MKTNIFNKAPKKSFTLVEVVVVIALVAIIGTLIISMMVPASNMFGVITYKVEAKMKTDQVMKTVVSQIRFSRELEISADAGILNVNADKRKLYSQNGKIYLKTKTSTQDLFSDAFYDKYTVSIQAKKIEGNLLNLSCTAQMKGDNTIQYTINTTVEVYNSVLITGDEGSILSYYWGEN